MRDCTGRDILEGDLITYPVRQGSRMWASTAVVIEVNRPTGILPGHIKALKFINGKERTITIEATDRVTIAFRASQIVDLIDTDEFIHARETNGN